LNGAGDGFARAAISMKNAKQMSSIGRCLRWIPLIVVMVLTWFGCDLLFSNWIEIKSFVRELF